jgi:hypothetical protein
VHRSVPDYRFYSSGSGDSTERANNPLLPLMHHKSANSVSVVRLPFFEAFQQNPFNDNDLHDPSTGFQQLYPLTMCRSVKLFTLAQGAAQTSRSACG